MRLCTDPTERSRFHISRENMSRQKSRCSSSGSKEGAIFGSESWFADACVGSKFEFRGKTRVESCILPGRVMTLLRGVEKRKLGRGSRSSGEGSVCVGVSRRSETLNWTWARTGSVGRWFVRSQPWEPRWSWTSAGRPRKVTWVARRAFSIRRSGSIVKLWRLSLNSKYISK